MIPSYRDHAANERTFLAWIRTGVAIMALGFVIERLDLLLASMRASAPDGAPAIAGQGEVHGLSVALVVVGMVLIGASSYRFVRTNRAIDAPQPRSFQSTLMPLGMALALLAVGVALLLYLLRLV